MMGACRKEASMKRLFFLIFLIGMAVLIVLAFAACSATHGSSGSGGAGAASSSATSSTAGTGGFTSSVGVGGSGGACLGIASKANPVPLDIFVMLDQSGSMLLDAGNAMTRWQTVKAAITSFVQQPSTAGI